MEIEGNR